MDIVSLRVKEKRWHLETAGIVQPCNRYTKQTIGAALMGKKVGEIAEAQLPSGTFRLRIESITLD